MKTCKTCGEAITDYEGCKECFMLESFGEVLEPIDELLEGFEIFTPMDIDENED